jgi:ADP-ribosylglycohydrolase
MNTSSKPTTLDRFRGCLLGGAVGDALGAPIEFMPLEEIVQTYGPDGPADLVDGPFPAGSFTDDTQMTLFVAEGVIRSLNSWAKHGDVPPIEVFLDAHWRWLTTQGRYPLGVGEKKKLSSWLSGVPELNDERAPGGTCIEALESGKIGTLENALNDSKGCGGVMRVAPVGLGWPGDPFLCGCEVAALTHGHPTGWLASGCMARIIHELVVGVDLEPAVERAMAELERYPDNEETLSALEHALAFEALGIGNAEEVECLGGGWIAEQALAIAVFCALVAPDFESAVRLAVTHTGDSDSTGSITGQILGTLYGVDAIPDRWLEKLELREVIDTVATDLHAAAISEGKPYDLKRYPAE